MNETRIEAGRDAGPRRDLVDARARLVDWLQARVPGADLAPFTLPKGNGGSNETLLSTMIWQDDAGEHRRGVVVHVEPPSDGALFFEADFTHKVRLMTLVRERTTGIPVPEILWFEPDPATLGAAFCVMERVDGQVPSDWPPYNEAGFLFDASPAERRRAWESAIDALARLHGARLSDEVDFLARPDRGATGLDQQIWWWRHMFEWSSPAGGPPPLARKLEQVMLATLPGERATALSWGDARIGNMIFNGFECKAILDWEMASLGGPLEDLGWWLFLDRWSSEGFGLARLDGLGSRTETIERWQQVSGLGAAGVEWYEMFAAYRMEAIMMRSAHLNGMPDFAHDNPVMRLIGSFDL